MAVPPAARGPIPFLRGNRYSPVRVNGQDELNATRGVPQPRPQCSPHEAARPQRNGRAHSATRRSTHKRRSWGGNHTTLDAGDGLNQPQPLHFPCCVGGDLLSHTPPGAVPSALGDFATGFGMDPGLPLPLWPPTTPTTPPREGWSVFEKPISRCEHPYRSTVARVPDPWRVGKPLGRLVPVG